MNVIFLNDKGKDVILGVTFKMESVPRVGERIDLYGGHYRVCDVRWKFESLKEVVVQVYLRVDRAR